MARFKSENELKFFVKDCGDRRYGIYNNSDMWFS